MGHDGPRWRIRLSTLMLLVIILALAMTLVVDRWNREQERRRLQASMERALAESWSAPASPGPPVKIGGSSQ
jgi:hypothetical protein